MPGNVPGNDVHSMLEIGSAKLIRSLELSNLCSVAIKHGRFKCKIGYGRRDEMNEL